MNIEHSPVVSRQFPIAGLHAIVLAVNLMPAILVRATVDIEVVDEGGEISFETVGLLEMVPGFYTTTGALLIALSLAAIGVVFLRSAWPTLLRLDHDCRFQRLLAAAVVGTAVVGFFVQIQRGDQASWLPDLNEVDSSLVLPFGLIASFAIAMVVLRRLPAGASVFPVREASAKSSGSGHLVQDGDHE